jgi:hypothetical protein
LKEWHKNAVTMVIVGVVAVLATVALAGCALGEKADPGTYPQPSAEVLDELRERYEPIYWLGDSFRGLGLTGVEVTEPGVVMAYGKPICRRNDLEYGSSCGYPIVITSGESRGNPFLPPAGRRHVCFDHAQGALLIRNCANYSQATLYSGAYEPGASGGFAAYLQAGDRGELDVREVARHLKTINGRLLIKVKRIPDLAHQLPPPGPISCPSLRFIVRWWTQMVEREFGPNPRCRPYGS